MHFLAGHGRAWPVVSLFLMLTAVAPRAATYYVTTTGSDSNPGVSTKPWRTLQKAANVVRAGDLVLVANGTYTGMEITTSGTVTAPITFRAGGSSVLVNLPNRNTPDNINIEGANYVIVEGFVVEDAPRDGIRAAIATGIKIRNNIVRRSGLTGILCGFTPSIEVSGNVSSGAQGEHGIYVANSTTTADNPVIRDNECFDNNRSGIQVNGDCMAGGDGVISGALLEGNVVHHNELKGLSLISMAKSTVRNNLIYENGLSGSGAGAIHLADEPGCGNPCSGNVVVNNTIDERSMAGIRMSDGSTGNTIFNNLIVVPSLSKAIADDSGGNTIDGTSNVKLTSDAGVFVSVSTGDYRLVSQSVAVDRASATFSGASAPLIDAIGIPRPQGSRLDAGAFEHTTTLSGVNDAPEFNATLEQNTPNPFNPATQIAFTVPAAATARVDLDVFDVRGTRVRTLVHDQPSNGYVRVLWDGRNDDGREVSSGVYFYRLKAGTKVLTRRMTLVK